MWEFLTDSGNAGTIGCVFFFSVFIYVLVSTYNPSKKKEMKDYGNIPLKED